MIDRETCSVMRFSVSGKGSGRMVPAVETRQRHIGLEIPRYNSPPGHFLPEEVRQLSGAITIWAGCDSRVGRPS